MDEKIQEDLKLWARLRFEQDGRRIPSVADKTEEEIASIVDELIYTEKTDPNEPNDWPTIAAVCLGAQKKIPDRVIDRMAGALAGRFAGCTLGVPVENYSIDKMEKIARDSGTPFPPTEYWHAVENPEGIQYGVDKRSSYSLGNIHGVPVDDDITYPVLNLILLERYGKDYSVEDAGELWKEILPYACTAEDSALKELKAGTPAAYAADSNPYIEWIGAAIRADAFGYACAGDPMGAAKLSYHDAYLTHRRNGIYGEMFAAAAVAAAFTAQTPLEAVKLGAACIPQKSRLAEDLRWAFSWEGKLMNYRHARNLLDERFPGMDGVHTLNNMCAVVFAIMLGEGDYTKTIANSIAMGLDNDCNGATVGSIVGANVGIQGVPEHWYAPFEDEVRTYLRGFETLSLQDLTNRFVAIYTQFAMK